MTTLGFIGTGNMGGALARAACQALPGDQVLLSNRTPEKAQRLAEELGCCRSDNVSIAQRADFIFLGVKPQMMAEMLAELAPILAARESRFLLVSMASGLSMEQIQTMAGGPYPVIRIMPNTPVSIGQGMILYACSPSVTAQEEQTFLQTMAHAGICSSIPEGLINAGSAVAGCGPAFVDLFLEALADGGVACGLSCADALQYAAQMTAGAARLVLESGKHPGQQKDAVCSPGGTTIQGVRALEAGGFRSAVMEAVIAAYEKTISS